MKRKTLASFMALLLVCSMLLAACGNNDAPSTSTTQPSNSGNAGDTSGG